MPSSLSTTLLASAAIAAAISLPAAAGVLAFLAIFIELILFVAAGFGAEDDGLGA